MSSSSSTDSLPSGDEGCTGKKSLICGLLGLGACGAFFFCLFSCAHNAGEQTKSIAAEREGQLKIEKRIKEEEKENDLAFKEAWKKKLQASGLVDAPPRPAKKQVPSSGGPGSSNGQQNFPGLPTNNGSRNNSPPSPAKNQVPSSGGPDSSNGQQKGPGAGPRTNEQKPSRNDASSVVSRDGGQENNFPSRKGRFADKSNTQGAGPPGNDGLEAKKHNASADVNAKNHANQDSSVKQTSGDLQNQVAGKGVFQFDMTKCKNIEDFEEQCKLLAASKRTFKRKKLVEGILAVAKAHNEAWATEANLKKVLQEHKLLEKV